MNRLDYAFSRASYFYALQHTSGGSSSYLQLLSLIIYFSKLAQKSGDAHKDFTHTAYLPPEMVHMLPNMKGQEWDQPGGQSENTLVFQ